MGIAVSEGRGIGSAKRDERLRTGYFAPRFEISEDDEVILEVSLVANGPPGLVKGENTMGAGAFEGGFPSSHGSRDRSEDSGDISFVRLDAVWLLADELNLLIVAGLSGAVLGREDLFGSIAKA